MTRRTDPLARALERRGEAPMTSNEEEPDMNPKATTVPLPAPAAPAGVGRDLVSESPAAASARTHGSPRALFDASRRPPGPFDPRLRLRVSPDAPAEAVGRGRRTGRRSR